MDEHQEETDAVATEGSGDNQEQQQQTTDIKSSDNAGCTTETIVKPEDVKQHDENTDNVSVSPDKIRTEKMDALVKDTEMVSEHELAVIEQKVRNQIEYYFSDISLSRDKFLLDLIAKDDGWVELTTMLKFNRLRQMTDNFNVIVNALKKSTTGLMEVNEDNTKIRRLPSRKLPENTKQWRDEIMARSVYAKKFADDSTLDELTTYFTANHGPTEQVFMRMWGPKESRKFKGSVFVTFEKKDDADKFVNADVIKYKNEELIRFYKQAYFDKKNAERDEKKRGGKSSNDTKKEAADSQLDDESDEKVKSQMTPGAILHLTGLSDMTKLTHIKTFFMDISPVSWVDINQSNKQAWVRFQTGVAQKSVDLAREANGGKLVINDAELESTVLEGDAELDYWKKLLKELENVRKQKRRPDGKRKFTRKGEKNKSNSKHKKFRESDDDNDDDKAFLKTEKDDSPPTKAIKLESTSE